MTVEDVVDHALWCHIGDLDYKTEFHKSGGTSTRYTREWAISTIPLTMPQRGESVETVTCPSCGKKVTIRIESARKEALRAAYWCIPGGLFLTAVGVFGLYLMPQWEWSLGHVGLVISLVMGPLMLVSPLYLARTQRRGDIRVESEESRNDREWHRVGFPEKQRAVTGI